MNPLFDQLPHDRFIRINAPSIKKSQSHPNDAANVFFYEERLEVKPTWPEFLWKQPMLSSFYEWVLIKETRSDLKLHFICFSIIAYVAFLGKVFSSYSCSYFESFEIVAMIQNWSGSPTKSCWTSPIIDFSC